MVHIVNNAHSVNYEADLWVHLVLLFLDSKVARNNFVEVPGSSSGFTGNFNLISAWDFKKKLLLLAQQDRRSKWHHQYLQVNGELLPSFKNQETGKKKKTFRVLNYNLDDTDMQSNPKKPILQRKKFGPSQETEEEKVQVSLIGTEPNFGKAPKERGFNTSTDFKDN